MKQYINILVAVIFIQLCDGQSDPIDYFGQTPPEDIPKEFEVYPSGSFPILHSSPSFSPSGDEAFWATLPTMNNQVIYFRTKENGEWGNPSIAPFSGGNYSDKLPCFSGDGQRVYFTSNRPLSGTGAAIDDNIWYVEKTASGWGAPSCLDNSVNSLQSDAWISVAANNNLYFWRNNKLYRAVWEDDHFLPAEEVQADLSGLDSPASISPDESYMIIQSEHVQTSPDVWTDNLYIIFHINEEWQEPIKLNDDINAMQSKCFSMISPDGKYLLFLGDNNNAYWVSTDFVEILRQGMGIRERRNFSEELCVFPNPTNDLLTMHFGTSPVRKAEISLNGLPGTCEYSETILNISEIIIDMTGYSKGIYLLKAVVDGRDICKIISKE